MATSGSWLIAQEFVIREGSDDIQVFHVNSHLSWEEAEAKGFPKDAWYGNARADHYAEQAAEAHQIDDNADEPVRVGQRYSGFGKEKNYRSHSRPTTTTAC